MLVAAAVVATSFPVGAAIARGLDPLVLTFFRFLLAAAMFLPIVGFRYGLTWPGWRSLGRYAAISACLVGFFWAMFEALRHTTALNSGAIFTLVPGLSAIYAAVLLRERLGATRLVALGLGLIGAIWVIFRGDPARLLALDANVGDAIFLVGCFFMALNAPLVRKLHRGEPMPVMTFWTLVTGSAWLLLLAATRFPAVDWAGVPAGVFAGIAYLALGPTLISFFLIQYCTMRLGPTRVMAYTYLNPLLVLLIEGTAGVGWPSPIIWPGVAIVVTATFVVQRGARAN